MKAVSFCLAALGLVFSFGCTNQTEVTNKSEHVKSTPQPMPDEKRPPIYVHIANMTSAELCDRLISIDTMPSRDPDA